MNHSFFHHDKCFYTHVFFFKLLVKKEKKNKTLFYKGINMPDNIYNFEIIKIISLFKFKKKIISSENKLYNLIKS